MAEKKIIIKEYSNTDVALLMQGIEFIKDDVRDIKIKLESRYITREEFEPIKRAVYGVIGLILTAVVGGLLTLLIKQ